jgi:hypothetical protein
MIMRLKAIQSTIQNAILKGFPSGDVIRLPPDQRCDKAIGVHQTAYHARLCSFLRSDYAKLYRYLGNDSFETCARAYADQFPSRTANPRWFGQAFPEFLKSHGTLGKLCVLHELAMLERALNDAFDAPDGPVVAKRDLAALDPENLAGCTFKFSSSVRRIELSHNTTSIWSALACGETPPSPYKLDTDSIVLVWRQGLSSRFRLLGEQEAMAVSVMQDGVSYPKLCRMLADDLQDENAAHTATCFLRGWAEAEIISELSIRGLADETVHA